MIGTMNLRVTVCTLLTQHLLGSAIRRNAGPAVNPAGVEGGQVTLLAQVGLACYQQVFVIGAVRRMADAAIFLHRGVFPQKRPALFRVAVIALLVDRIADQVARPVPAMRLVAIGA